MSTRTRNRSKVQGAYVKAWKLWYVMRIILIGGMIALVGLAAKQPIFSAVVGGATLLVCVIAVRSPMRWNARARVLDLTPSRATSASEHTKAMHHDLS